MSIIGSAIREARGLAGHDQNMSGSQCTCRSGGFGRHRRHCAQRCGGLILHAINTVSSNHSNSYNYNNASNPPGQYSSNPCHANGPYHSSQAPLEPRTAQFNQGLGCGRLNRKLDRLMIRSDRAMLKAERHANRAGYSLGCGPAQQAPAMGHPNQQSYQQQSYQQQPYQQQPYQPQPYQQQQPYDMRDGGDARQMDQMPRNEPQLVSRSLDADAIPTEAPPRYQERDEKH